MSATMDSEAHFLKSKRSLSSTAFTQPHVSNSNTPVTFFLRSEAEMDQSIAQSEDLEDRDKHTFVENEITAASTASTSFGVQSLEDAMTNSEEALSASPRAAYNEPLLSSSILAGLKRRPGNPVHPKIYATGQRIVSNDLQSSMLSSPSGSPIKIPLRRSSVSSSTHLTPLNVSANADTASPGTPRTSSMRSFKLSDEELSVASDTGSQAVHSSSSEEEAMVPLDTSITSAAHRESELVMPSIAIPSRRPFTARGRSMGQLKIAMSGAKAVGKSSLIRSIIRSCEDIVHVEYLTASSSAPSLSDNVLAALGSTSAPIEYQASTKPYPSWWSDTENSRAWWRRKSVGEAVLERNIRFIDTQGEESSTSVMSLIHKINKTYSSMSTLGGLTDSEMLDLLSGRSGMLYDVVLHLFRGDQTSLTEVEASEMRQLAGLTNLIPVIAQSDKLSAEEIIAQKEQLWIMLTTADIDFCSLSHLLRQETRSSSVSSPQDIFAVSSHADDGDIMDASTLMASNYLPPLSKSDLDELIDTLFEPSSMAHLRQRALIKFVKCQRTQQSGTARVQKSPRTDPKSFDIIETSSDESSRLLVPQVYPTYLASTTSSASDSSDIIFSTRAAPAVEPSRHLHIAKWARDLRRSLRMDGGMLDDISARPAKGRLGGELGIIDPRDPLGISSFGHAFGRQGLFALQIFGGLSVVSAAVWWLSRNWIELQEWIWPGQGYTNTPIVVGAPARSWLDSLRLL